MHLTYKGVFLRVMMFFLCLCCARPEDWGALRLGPCKCFSRRTDSHVTETGPCQYWGLKLWKCVNRNVGWSLLVDRNDFLSVSQWRVSPKKEKRVN